MTESIGFIGGGNMARSLIGGILAKGHDASAICVSEPDADKRAALESDFGIVTTQTNADLVANTGIVVLAVKPQVMAEVLTALATSVQSDKPLIVSIAAGVTMSAMSTWLDGYTNVVRVMPNTPALVGRGASGLYAHSEVNEADRQKAQQILDAVGITRWVDSEEMIDAVTGVSGSGPAYFFYMMEAMQEGALSLGLDEDTARQLVLQTALGAAELACSSNDSFSTLRVQVTSPGGTTEKALKTLNESNCGESIAAAVRAASDRSRELAQLLTRDEGDKN